jgi:hypothetical protein
MASQSIPVCMARWLILLNTKGFAATAYDLPGHGKTIG